jgi:glycosyltransferase involved in cell wall biosynthesis
MKRYADLPIEWSPPLPHAILADRLRSADVFVFPSLEDGWARTVSEAMACGLPCVVTPNTGAKDSIVEGAHGSIVPIRDAQAIAESTLHWWDKIQTGLQSTVADLNSQLSLEVAEKAFNAAIAAVKMTK